MRSLDLKLVHSGTERTGIQPENFGCSMGAFDAPTGTHLEKHIFVADKGDYYEIRDGLPQNPQ